MRRRAENKTLKIPLICPGIEVTRHDQEISENYMKELQKKFDYKPLMCPGIEVKRRNQEISENYMRELQAEFDYEPVNFLIGYHVPNQFRPKREKYGGALAKYLDRLFMDGGYEED